MDVVACAGVVDGMKLNKQSAARSAVLEAGIFVNAFGVDHGWGAIGVWLFSGAFVL